MENIFISLYQQTCFYVNLSTKQYGVCINIEDIDRKNEIMENFYNDEANKRTIEAWKNEWKEGVV